MPTTYVKKLAKKHHVSVSKAESRWKRAKANAKKQGHDEEYDYITGIFKHMMGEGFPITFKDFHDLKILKEGVWSAPQTKEKAKKLLQLLSKPLHAKEATEKLYNLVGDDNLFDELDDIKRAEPNEDVRQLVISHVRKWIEGLDRETEDGLNNSENPWKTSWDPEAVGMLRNVEDEEHYQSYTPV